MGAAPWAEQFLLRTYKSPCRDGRGSHVLTDSSASSLRSCAGLAPRPGEGSQRTGTWALCSRCLLDVRHGDGRSQHTVVYLRPQGADGGCSPGAFFGLVNREVTTVDVPPVERADGSCAFFGGSHLDEAETA